MPDLPTVDLGYVTGPVWVTNFTISNSSATNDTTWSNWVLTAPVTSTTTIRMSSVVWQSWVRDTRDDWIDYVQPPPPRPPQEAAERREQREARRLLAERASARAEELLLSCLDEEQRDQLAALDRFSVTAASGRVYWIERGYAGNVRSGGYRYCIHGPVDLPHADQMLMQKLLLETDEQGFLRTANESRDHDPMVLAA